MKPPLVVTQEVLTELIRLGHSTRDGKGVGSLSGVWLVVESGLDGAEPVAHSMSAQQRARRLSGFARDS